MEASEPKWVNPDDIQYEVNLQRFGGLLLISNINIKMIRDMIYFLNVKVLHTDARFHFYSCNYMLYKIWKTARQTNVTAKTYWGDNYIRNYYSNASIVLAVTSLCLIGLNLISWHEIFKILLIYWILNLSRYKARFGWVNNAAIWLFTPNYFFSHFVL